MRIKEAGALGGRVKKSRLFAGTSGWHYEHWKGPFYPAGLPAKNYLDHYIQFFKTVEINRTFYGLPERKVFLDYAKRVPTDFVFAIKASRFITHIKRLKDPKPSLQKLFSCVDGLGSHLGPILFQLPPHWELNLERLRSFLKALPKRRKYAFEFRNSSWLVEEVYDLLREYGTGFCIYDLNGFTTDPIVTTDFVYVRLHGPKAAYKDKYPLSSLKKWSRF
ncbi:MAG: DUF72 domain-containing protein, partial [Chlamydiales bacterium]